MKVWVVLGLDHELEAVYNDRVLAELHAEAVGLSKAFVSSRQVDAYLPEWVRIILKSKKKYQ
jgi:hypothetical protein